MSVDVKYRTRSQAVGGRDGTARSLDNDFAVTMSTPKEIGGAGAPGVNPEQLFATGYAACFLGALKLVAAQQKIRLPAETTITAEVGIGPRAAGGFGLTVALQVAAPGIEHAQAQALMEAAHQVCPYSNATRGNIDVALSVA